MSNLRLYLVSRPNDPDTIEDTFYFYRKFMVCCDNEITARNTHPVRNIELRDGKWMYKNSEKESYEFSGWLSPEYLDKVKVEYYGEAGYNIQPGVIIHDSMNRG